MVKIGGVLDLKVKKNVQKDSLNSLRFECKKKMLKIGGVGIRLECKKKIYCIMVTKAHMNMVCLI